MRNHAFTRLKTLLTAACVSLYTKRRKAAKPKYRLEPVRSAADTTEAWLFENEGGIARETNALSKEMGALSSSLSGLRETLDLLTGVTPFPTRAQTEMPCAILAHDSDLFEGEPLAEAPVQDTVIGGDDAFLFETDQDAAQLAQHAA